MCMSIKAPTRNMGQEVTETLETQLKLAPDVYEATAKYSPLYSALELKNFRESLTGDDGMLALYENEIAPAMQRGQAASSAGDVAMLEQLGPRAVAAMEGADPETKMLLDEMTRQAMEELQMGAKLDPSLAREVTQGIRGGQAARGLGMGTSDVTEETVARALQAERLRGLRRDFAGRVYGMRKAGGIDPAMVILGRPAQGGNLIGQGAAGAQQASANVNFDPMQNPYAQDYWNTVYNARSAAKIAGNNANAAIWGSVIESGAQAAGAAAGACWVARAVYGNSDLRWVDFREWLLNYASEKFRGWYLQNGERYAGKVAGSERLRRIWYRFMEAKRKALWRIRWEDGQEGINTEGTESTEILKADFRGEGYQDAV